MGKVILVLSDGLRYDTAADGMGYLGHLVEVKLASLYRVTGELPSLSRPMYEILHTGLPVSEHGTVSNLLYLIRPGLPGLGRTDLKVSQLQIAPTLCKLLALEIPETMKAVALV